MEATTSSSSSSNAAGNASATSSAQDQTPSAGAPIVELNENRAPTVLILGMAGAGKTALVQRLSAHLHAANRPPYLINLDPAVHHLPYPANVDIRDTVNYGRVMSDYSLGPNGAILTSLNLFCTRFGDVLEVLARRSESYSMCVVDTPGQIEAFTWSASGAILTDALASFGPTVVVFVVDAPRASSPTTFMSNMLYACSVLYRTKLPFVVAFNKADVVSPAFLKDWMLDFDKFNQALEDARSCYLNDLSRSLSLVLDKFYSQLESVGVSAQTGEGMDELCTAIQRASDRYRAQFLPIYRALVAKRNKEKQDVKGVTARVADMQCGDDDEEENVDDAQ